MQAPIRKQLQGDRLSTEFRNTRGSVQGSWGFRLFAFGLVAIPYAINGCVAIGGPAMTPVEGIIQAAESAAPLPNVSVVVRRLSGTELGRGEGMTDAAGKFRIVVPVLAESPATDVYEVTVQRDNCESVFSLDADIEVEFVDLPFPQTFYFRITNPILVPPCDAEGDGAP